VDANVEVWSTLTLHGAVGVGRDVSLVLHSTGGLQVPVLAKLSEALLYIRGGTEKYTHDVTARGFMPYPGAVQPASPSAPTSAPKYEDGVVTVECPGSDIQGRSSADVGVEESVGLIP
jgi:hypothetical protein